MSEGLRVGTLSYATCQGLGYLAKAFYDNGIITDPIIYRHNSRHRTTHTEWYPEGTPIVNRGGELKRFTSKIFRELDAMLFFETPFHWPLINECKRYGVRSILMPMYEWTPEKWPVKPDALFCPSLLDYKYFYKQFRCEDCVFTPVPVETKYWKLRKTASSFLHNAGNVGYREHKGTRQLLHAIKHVESSDFRLTVRAQDTATLRSIVSDAQPDERVDITYGEVSYDDLWGQHDVYVAPEKFNGLSLPLQEAYSSGMLVMTTDRFPMNTWLPHEPLIPVEDTQMVRVSRPCYEIEECIVNPISIAQCIDTWIGRDITEFSVNAHRWAEEHSWEIMKPFYLEAIKCAIEGKQCPTY